MLLGSNFLQVDGVADSHLRQDIIPILMIKQGEAFFLDTGSVSTKYMF